MERRALAFACLFVGFGVGCSHSEKTARVRSALDSGNPRAAIAYLNEEMDVDNDDVTPADMVGDNALFVLDRATVQQSLSQFPKSQRDFQAADKAIDLLDMSSNAADTIGKYVFSDSAGRYMAPPYEKLLINTLNMVNYLEQHDLNGARIEARRLTVMQRYLKDTLHQEDSAILGLSGFLAGFAFEKSGKGDEALHFYDDALAVKGLHSLRAPVRELVSQGATYTTPRIRAAAGEAASEPLGDDGEIVIVVGYGRVPHKVANRIPIGLALTYVAGSIHPGDRAAADRLAAQGLVTWVNFPTLAPEQGGYSVPRLDIDGRGIGLEESVDVSGEVRAEWKKIEGPIILSAITRMITRAVAGEGVKAAAGKDNQLLGLVLSLGTQATLTALDNPDTRSWETIPARVSVARVRVKPGRHTVTLDARGVSRKQSVQIDKGGWGFVSLMALR